MPSSNRREARKTGMRRDGTKKQQIGVKFPEPIRRFVEERAAEENASLSDVIRDAAALYKDLLLELGPEWHEAQRLAAVNKQSVGTAIASMLRGSLEQHRKNRK